MKMPSGGRGVANEHGFYSYTPEEARLWEETFERFSYEIRALALRYPADVVSRAVGRRRPVWRFQRMLKIKLEKPFWLVACKFGLKKDIWNTDNWENRVWPFQPLHLAPGP